MENASILIIGGGVVGSSVAYHLTLLGARDVVILERGRCQGQGSSGKATGGVRAQFETDINVKMSLYSIDFFANWDRYCGYDPKGYLFFATSDAQMRRLMDGIRMQRLAGYAGVEAVDTETIRRMVPGMNCGDIVGGSFGARDGFIDPLAVMTGFTEEAVQRGARVQLSSEVLSINVTSGRVRSVSTGSGEIECDAVVLCTGPWAKELAATAGIDLPVSPIKRQIVCGRTADDLPKDLPMVIDVANGFHFRPAKEFGRGPTWEDPANQVLLAYPDEQSSSAGDCVDDDFVDKVRAKARHRADFLGEAEVLWDKCRAGFYENTPDHHAILGDCEVEGLFLANGFSGHGVMHSPAAGRAVAEMIIHGQSNFLDVSPLKLNRFAAGRAFREAAYI
jgi:sarcosine oxidase, subunit beta